MVEKDRDAAEPTEASLELPSLGLRRRRRDKGADADAAHVAEEGADPGARAPAPGRPEPAAVPGPVAVPTVGPEPAAAPTAGPEPTAAAPGRARRRPPALALPALSGAAAALVAGLAVGLVGVLLTLGSLAACEAVRGTSSCGGPGALLLLAILAVMVLLGRALLGAWQVRDPGSTSLLAVGLVAVLALTVLIEVILSWTMVIVVPLVAMAAFGVSHWVTTKVAEAEA